MVEDLITSGRIANIILAVLAVEAALVGFLLWRRQQARGLLSFLASLLAGAALVLCLRAALMNAGWPFVAIFLLAALLAHLAETVLRLLPAAHDTDRSAKDLSHTP